MKQAIRATAFRKKAGYPKVMYFTCTEQAEVENVMTALGFGSSQYWLSIVDIIARETASLYPRKSTTKSRRKVPA